MSRIDIVAENAMAYVLQKGEEYTKVRIKDKITSKTRWRGIEVLDSAIAKGRFDEVIPSRPYYEKVEKSRKSVDRLDEGKMKSKKTGLSLTIEEFGLENFEKDLVSTNVVRKSSENFLEPELTIDLEKAGKKHIPKGAERYSYRTPSEYGIIYIPVNRLNRVYQSKDASNKAKVRELRDKMNVDKVIDPVEIGYNYDVLDGHHRWDASIEAGFTHVPCVVRGKDPEKTKKAKRNYRKLWKSMDKELTNSLEDNLKKLVLLNLTDEDEAIQAYADILGLLEDGNVRDIILEIMEDELDHYHNLSQVLRFLEGDESAIEEGNLKKSEEIDLVLSKSESVEAKLILDLEKSDDPKPGGPGKLDKSKLVQVSIMVQGKNGAFRRLQWMNRDAELPKGAKIVNENKSSYAFSKEGISDIERRQSNKFPVIHYPTKDMKNTEFNYHTDTKAFNDALDKYYNGEELPFVKISPTGEILDNHHLVDLAKKVGISHIPTIVVGNPSLKKDLEDRMKDKVTFVDSEGNEETLTTRRESKTPKKNLSKDVVEAIQTFKNITVKKYPKQYLLEQAKEQGIEWNSISAKSGEELPPESNILWMRAHQSIVAYIEEGYEFELTNEKKAARSHMKQKGKDGVETFWLDVMEQFGSDKEAVMEHARDTGISWKERKDPHMNWMIASMKIKDHMRAGGMFAGIRTRQKDLIHEQSIVVTEQMRKKVTTLKDTHGKNAMFDRADTLGITYPKENKKGEPYAPESRILWMGAHQAISKYIAEGNIFTMSDDVTDDGLKSEVFHNPHELTTKQLQALEVGRRNTQEIEAESKEWAMNVFKVDRGITGQEAEDLYKKFMDNARKAKIKLRFNPGEIIKGNTKIIDQVMSDGEWKNDYAYGRGYDYEQKGSNENDMFTDEYWDTPDEERPVYANIDLFNHGYYGFSMEDCAFVMKDSVRERSTGSYVDANNIPYGQEGKTVRSMEDPHHLIIDRWRSKWKNPKRKDNQRIRAMDAVLEGKVHKDDIEEFEVHIHGKIDLYKDVDYIEIPNTWHTSNTVLLNHHRIGEFAEAIGAGIKYIE